ncbi:hypothetical protein BKA70DRAFT_162171 [Coprinopsis sp. MPI-PUGE-AT-0042]|nr:hypothetical protein BKA70DRAFT_162171 [Coprinopsis sp. MPI-PUGE-AT-0042]
MQTKKHLRSLEANHRTLEHQVLQLTQLFPGPIKHLPIELLSHIFTLACEGEYVRLYLEEDRDVHLPENHDGKPDCDNSLAAGYPPEETKMVEHRRSTALVLTEVCRQWRATAIALSSLWARLDLDARDLHRILGELLSDDSDDADSVNEEEALESPVEPEDEAARRREASFFACVRRVFARSRHCALDIKLARPSPESKKVYDGFASALEMVVLHAERIRTLQCENFTFHFLHCDMDFPSLQELHLINYLPRGHNPISLATPHLARLTLLNPCCIIDDHLLSDLDMSWTSLTTFSLFWNNSSPYEDCANPSDLPYVVAAMPNLEVFRINLGEINTLLFEAFDPSQSSTTLLARLHTLEIQDQFMSLLDLDTMAAFDTPRLERFDYHSTLAGDTARSPLIEKDTTSLTSLLSSSSCLKTVNIVYAQDVWFLDPVDSLPKDGYWVAEIAAVKFETLVNLCAQWPTLDPNERTKNSLSPEQLLFTECGARLRRTIPGVQWPKEGYVEDLVGWIKENTDLASASTYTERKFGLENFETLAGKLQVSQAAVDRGAWSFFVQLNLL